MINLNEITLLRLVNQQIATSKLKTPKEVIGWMGTVRAQDYSMSKWAVCVRFPGSTDKSVESECLKLSPHKCLRKPWNL